MKRTTFLQLFCFFPLLLCLMVQDCFATQWAKTFGGVGHDYAHSIQQTTDGGYIIGGYTRAFGVGNYDIWVLKLDQTGTVTWQKTYGGDDGDYTYTIQQTTDGGYIVGGETYSFGVVSRDFWVLKLDREGNVTWQKTYGGINIDGVYSCQQTSDGGYIIAGRTDSFGAGNPEMWIVKLYSNGDVSWQKTYGGNDWGRADSIQQTKEGGYIVAGGVIPSGTGNTEMWVLKLDSTGNVSWQKTYGGENLDFARSIQQTKDGGYIVTGYTESFGVGGYDVWVLKLDSTGTISWQKTYGGSGGDDDASFIQETTDGGYIVAGYTESFGAGSYDIWVLKLDSTGTISWQKTYGGSIEDYAYCIRENEDGGYIVAGRTNSFGSVTNDLWILKLDSNGSINSCNIVDESTASVTNTTITSVNSNASVSLPSPAIANTPAIPQDTSALIFEQCFAPDWFSTDPPTQDNLNGVWGYISSQSIHEFYAVGENGLVIHFNGTNWTQTGNLTSFELNGVWGSSETEIFTVGEHGTIFHYADHNQNDQYSWADMEPGFTVHLKDVWGSSTTDVYAVGEVGFIGHFNGSTWSEVTISSTITENLTSIWGSASDNYVAVGEGGTILTYNGTVWAEVDPSPTTKDLGEVWGSASDNIYAVGKGGTIIHYNGSTWSEVTTSPTSANLRGIWGSTANNIFVVGEHGTILYYDGTTWVKMDSGVQDSLVSTFGTLNPRVMVVGYDGNILSLGGPSVQGKICNSCTGQSIHEVTVEFDKNIGEDEGVEYQIAQTDADGIYPTIPSQGGPYPILITATDYLIKEITVDLPFNSSIVDHATYLLPDPGYQDCLSGTITRTVQIGTIPKENDRGVQNMGVKLYQGDTLIGSTVTDIGGNYHFNLTGLDPGSYRVEPFIAASECSTIPSEHTDINLPFPPSLLCDQDSTPPWCSYDFDLICPEPPEITQGYWQEMASGTENLLHSIWGSASTNIYAVGDNGEIIHYGGTSWTSQTSTTTENLKGIWGSSGTDIYAVGAAGTIVKTEDGGTTPWSSMTSGTPNGLNAIWGNAATDIFAVGDQGTIIHGNGTSWTLIPSGTQVKLLGVWGNSGTDVYAVGNSHKDGYWKRTVLHYDGATWSEVSTGNGVTLMSPWGSATDDITAAGSFGSIMRYKEWVEGEGPDWKHIGGPTEKTLNAMWGSSGNNIFAVGYKGVIAHYDGTEWSVRETATPNDLYGIWGNSGTEVYAIGDNGTILEYTGDIDNDGEGDDTDNCINVSNPGQENNDEDGLGDVCDNCPLDTNGDQANSDHDSLGNACDNCPLDTNEGQENEDEDSYGDVCDNCPTNTNENQADTFPPQGNNCGDACECEGNFDGDNDVDGGDAAFFKSDFGRSGFKNPCNNEPECKGNFDCDLDVDGADAALFKEDFGRSSFKNPCPSCSTEQWCIY